MEFSITYQPLKAVKGQAIADFLAEHPIPVDSPLNCELPDEHAFDKIDRERGGSDTRWELYFDGASSITKRKHTSSIIKSGVGLIFVTPQGGIMRFAFSLTEPRTNNEADTKL